MNLKNTLYGLIAGIMLATMPSTAQPINLTVGAMLIAAAETTGLHALYKSLINPRNYDTGKHPLFSTTSIDNRSAALFASVLRTSLPQPSAPTIESTLPATPETGPMSTDDNQNNNNQNTAGLRQDVQPRIATNSWVGDRGSEYLGDSFDMGDDPLSQSFLQASKNDDEDFKCPVVTITAGDEKSCIGLLCVHGTWSSNMGMGADSNRVFSDALYEYAKKLSHDKNKTVKMIMPQWSGELSNDARLNAAYAIDKKLNEMNAKCPFDELHGIGHSHGCNVLLKLSLIAPNSDTFSVNKKITTMILLAPPRVDFGPVYNYPAQCTIYAFHSPNDATQQLGSFEQGKGFEQRLPITKEQIGKVYNITVEYLPEVGKPHHKSIKNLSLIDCLPSIQELIHKVFTRYTDLRLWITENNGVYQPAFALHDKTETAETNEANIMRAQEMSKNCLEHLPTISPRLMQQASYLVTNLLREMRYIDPKLQ